MKKKLTQHLQLEVMHKVVTSKEHNRQCCSYCSMSTNYCYSILQLYFENVFSFTILNRDAILPSPHHSTDGAPHS